MLLKILLLIFPLTILLKVSILASDQVPSEYRRSDGRKPSSFFYFITTEEGLYSHLKQFEEMWKIAVAVDRTVVLAGFYSGHFNRKTHLIQICDMFIMPSNFICLNMTKEIVLASVDKCYDSEDLKEVTALKYIDCFSGTPHNLPHLSTDPIIPETDMPILFQPKYEKWLTAARIAYNVKENGKYITLHWRRGDQLHSRCFPVTGKPSDTSLNCVDVKDFIIGAKKAISDNIHQNDLTVYVSTIEITEEETLAIQKAGFYLLTDLHKVTDEIGIDKDIDLLMFETTLMCDSTWFIGWGHTSANFIIPRCRTSRNHNITTSILIDSPF